MLSLLSLLAGGSVIGACAALAIMKMTSCKSSNECESTDAQRDIARELRTPSITSTIASSPLPRSKAQQEVNRALQRLTSAERLDLSVNTYAPGTTEGNLLDLERGSLMDHLQSANLAGTIVVGVAGGTGSGKTTLARAIRETCDVAYISHDNYYKDLSHLSMEERETHNFDHPDSLDTDRLYQDVLKLKNGQDVNVPIYDFSTHTRTKNTELVRTQKIILVEGILIFTHPELRDIIDVKIYVDTSDDIRFIRRLTRDLKERGRDTESVVAQYMKTVRPMHLKFVEPSKVHADVIVPVGLNQAVLDMVIARLRFAAEE